MRSWIFLLGGLLVWTAHFFVLYGIGEFAGASAAARGVVILVTAIALAVDGLLAWRLRSLVRADEFARWHASIANGGLLLSVLAIIWQALPAAIG